MKHIVLFKFYESKFNEDVYQDICGMYSEIEKQILNLGEIAIKQNCVNQKRNSELYIEINYDSLEALNEYLNHPLHLQFKDKYKSFIEKQSIIDIN